MGSVTETQPMNMKIFVAIAFLVAVTECRRHLCEDGTRPVCPNGDKAVYNRPTGKNTDGSKYFPPPVCSGEGKPVCADGSEARVMFNQCTKDKMSVPQDKGLDLQISLSQPVVMDQSVTVQEVVRTASSATRCATMGRAAVLSVGRVYHTAHGPPRTGTSMMGSGSTTLGSTDLGIRLRTGDLDLLEISLKL